MENSSTNQFGCSSIGIIPQNWASTRKKIIENPVVHRVSHEPVSIPKQTQCPPPTRPPRPPRPSKPLPLLKRRSTSMVSRVLWMTGPNWWRHRIGHSYHAHFIGIWWEVCVCVCIMYIYIYINRHNTYHIVLYIGIIHIILYYLYIYRHNTYHIVLYIYI